MADEIISQKRPRKKRALKPLPDFKPCSRCKEVLPASSFSIKKYKTVDGGDGCCLTAECKKCHQVPMSRGGIKPAQPLRSESQCSECRQTKPVGRFTVTRNVAKRGTISYSVSGRCKDCGKLKRRRPFRKLKKINPVPDSKRCFECKEVKLASEFYVSKDKTSTGRPKLKIHTRCKVCQSRIAVEKARIARIGRVRKPSKKKLPLDQPKKCAKCGVVKPPEEFPTCKRRGGELALYGRCKQCGHIRASAEQARAYVKKRRLMEQSDPFLMAEKKRYAAENFGKNLVD